GVGAIGGGVFELAGTGLNGISEGASSGTRGQMATNFPIIQLIDDNFNVTFARTFNWTSTDVATGNAASDQTPQMPNTPQTTDFTLPPGKTLQDYQYLSVIASGISSNPAKSYIDFGETLDNPLETSDGPPALAIVRIPGYAIPAPFLAWTGRSNEYLNIMELNSDDSET